LSILDLKVFYFISVSPFDFSATIKGKSKKGSVCHRSDNRELFENWQLQYQILKWDVWQGFYYLSAHLSCKRLLREQ